MEDNAFIGDVIAGLVFLVAGFRLLGLAAQTRRAPERLLSASFLVWGIGYLLYDIPYAIVDDAALRTHFFLASRVSIDAGSVTFALFTRCVFRPGRRWAAWLVAGTAICLVGGVAGSVWVGDWEGVRPLSNPWYWLERPANFVPVIWMTTEGLLGYAKNRRRRRLGLCDPLVCNRFLLWGISGALWVLLELALFPQEIGYEAKQEFSAALGILSGLLEVAPVALIWLAFFPPAFYRRWIAGGATAAEESPKHCG